MFRRSYSGRDVVQGSSFESSVLLDVDHRVQEPKGEMDMVGCEDFDM